MRNTLSCRVIFFCTALFALFFAISPVLAAESSAVRNVPTSINADSMEYSADNQRVVFIGHVYVKRPDFELWSETLTVFLDKSGKKTEESELGGAGGMQTGSIDHIVAEKNVRMKSGEREGTCQKATYFAKADKFVMEGSPVLRNTKDQSNIMGTVITHFLKANRSEVQRPQATFFTRDDSKDALLPGSKGKR